MYSGQFILMFRRFYRWAFSCQDSGRKLLLQVPLWVIPGRENKSRARRYLCVTFYYLFVGKRNNTFQPLTSIRFLSPCLCWLYITQGRKVLAFDLCSLTMRCPGWLITQLGEFAVVLTFIAPDLKQINVCVLPKNSS